VTSAWAGRAAALAAFCFVAVLQVHRLDDSDTWWHLASGRLIAETGAVTHTDPFSYTAAGAPWINRQWLFELGLFEVWRLGGPAGIALAAGGLFLGAFACLYAVARRRLPAGAAAVLVFIAAQAAVERFTVRPEAVTFLLIGAYLLLLDGPLPRRRLLALVALQAVWANTHALSVLGIVLIGAELAGSAACTWVPLPAGWRAAGRRDRRELIGLAFALVAAALAETATPFGLKGALYPLWLLTLIRGGNLLSYTVIEHRATTLAELAPPAAAALVLLVVLTVLAALASWRRWRLSHALTAAAFLVLALMARRNVGLLGLGVAPFVAGGLGPALATLDRRWGRRPALATVLGAGLVLVFAVESARVVSGRYYERARLTRTFGLGESWLLFPAGAVNFLARHAPSARVLNDDVLGGYLLWRSYPPRQVFFDGRLQVYPSEVIEEYQSILDDPRNFPAVAARWGITAVLLHHPSPGRLELAAAISRLPGWRVAYLDGGGVVLLADGEPRGEPAGARAPIVAASTPGIAGGLERLLGPVRLPTEEATAYYQRGRALLMLGGPDRVAEAREDFRRTLSLQPGMRLALIALRATGGI
jgi:hypothetical protein